MHGLPDAYLTDNFRIKWEGRYVAAVTSVSGLTGPGPAPGGPKTPGTTDYEPIRLERGVITDTAFDAWANLVWSYPNEHPDNEFESASFGKPMQIELYDQQGIIVRRYDVYQCWPSEYTSLPPLDSEPNVVVLESMTIEHEGWHRDPSVTDPPTGVPSTQP
jgi:phage tail-like protein